MTQQIREDEPTEETRLGVYVLELVRGQRRVAECSIGSLGLCLVTLRDEGQITNDSRVGILDRVARRWFVNPYASGR